MRPRRRTGSAGAIRYIADIPGGGGGGGAPKWTPSSNAPGMNTPGGRGLDNSAVEGPMPVVVQISVEVEDQGTDPTSTGLRGTLVMIL